MITCADADLLNIEASYADCGGAFIVLEDERRKIVASHATLPIDPVAGILTLTWTNPSAD